MKTSPFKNKVCWVTGASSGIGAALSIALNAQGATVIVSARNREKLETVQAESPYPEHMIILTCDMEEIEKLPGRTLEAWNLCLGIDYVFLNAGMVVRDLIVDTEMEIIQKVMNVNFFSNAILSKSLIPMMQVQGHGCFVVTGSLCGKFGVPKLSAYAASKHALQGFYESLRAEHEMDGIKVMMATVGLVKTDISRHSLKGNGTVNNKIQASIEAGISPETCARNIIKAAALGKHEILVGALEKYSVYLKRFFQGIVRWAITRHPMKKIRKLGLWKNWFQNLLRAGSPLHSSN